ncbi:Pre-mRNA-splicing factor cwc26 [Tulasnella sp. JGI-2019a]|nr:Pre-mRNA-splicing factor cwc26 [Tulasnella sp. JGI-2019a]
MLDLVPSGIELAPACSPHNKSQSVRYWHWIVEAMSSMQAYLASKYMSGPKADAILARASTSTTATKKKKKRKDGTANDAGGSGAFIRDEEEELRWGKPIDVDDDKEAAPMVEKDRGFKKRKVDEAGPNKEDGSAGWITVREGEGDVKVEEDVAPKFAGGLVQASELQAVLPQSSLTSKKKGKTRTVSQEPPPEEQETVYRDASGRKIDMKLEKAAAAREKRLQEEKEAQKMEWGKGLVQRQEAERLKREEEAEKTRGMARYADDKDLNEIQKSQDRWNDPAAAFLTKKEKKGPRKPMYNGPPPPPNRFGILPGWRWDGVDRGNGFEKKYFQRANERGRTKLEAYQWSVDDM